MYLTRHNDELKKNAQAVRLAKLERSKNLNGFENL
jgi:hypothetical protein